MLSKPMTPSINLGKQLKHISQRSCPKAFTHSLMSLSLIVSCLALSFSSTHASPFTDAQKRFSAYRDRVFQLQSNENTKYLSGELSTLTQWISQAERHLREEDEDEFIKLVKLIQAQVRLVDISLEELDAREQLLKLHEEVKRTEAKAKSEREAVVEIEKMMGGSLNQTPIQAPIQQAPIQQGGR